MQQIVQDQTVRYFESVNPALEGLGEYFVNTTPIMIAANQMRQNRQGQMAANGVGQVDNLGPGAVVLGLGFLALAGALSYQAGKAMAPNKKAEMTWGIVGIPMGLFLPFGMGLGIMGAISNAQK